MNNEKDYMQGLGANERAILERIPILMLRKTAASIVRAKIRVQFTGWLQYLIPVIFILLFSLLGGISQLINARFLSISFLLLGMLTLTIAIFDLLTVKYGLRFPERIPKRNDNLDIFDLMRKRHSCRSFQTRKLTTADHNELMESVRVHTEEDQIGKASIRFEYISAPLTVWPVVNATEFIVAIVPKEYHRMAIIDIGRSLQKIVMDATRMGLGTCWIGPGADQLSIVQKLGEQFDTEKDHIVCVSAVGYKSNYIPLFLRIFSAQTQRRLPLSKLFYDDGDIEQPLNISKTPFSRFGRNYEICQWAPSSFNGQTTRAVANMDDNGNLRSFDFYTTTTSRYYAPISVGIWCANWELGCEAQGINGLFSVLTAEENQQLPKYNVSWVFDNYPQI